MRKSLAILAGVLIGAFLLGFGVKEPASQAGQYLGEMPPWSLDRSFGKMPVYFITNQGQVDSRVDYYLQGKDKTIYFASEGLTYVLSEERVGAEKAGARSRWVVKLDFVGANSDVRPSGEEKTEAVISYFRGSPEEWKTGLSTYSKVAYRDLWPGIDLVYYGTTDRLKYEFIVDPGADPSQIRLAYRGAKSVTLNKEGQLEVETPAGGFEDDVPVAWQEAGGQRVEVPISYELEGHQYGFQVGDYDGTQTLVLDPAVLVYCGYIGGSSGYGPYDSGSGIAVDSFGNAYFTGYTMCFETTFPVTVGPDLTYNGGAGDAFVAKVNSSGTALVYCGYIGGEEADAGRAIAVDSEGNAYITGETLSSENTFPVEVGPDLQYGGGTYGQGDAFVAKVNSSGTALSYCGYIGGSIDDYGYGIGVDGAGSAYIAGATSSTEATFPVTGGPDLTHNGGNMDAFVAKVNASGSAFVYCGYVGGEGGEVARGLALDGYGNVYITGYVGSTETTFPVSVGPDLTHSGGLYDAFVAKVIASGGGLSYCGYIGGSDWDYGGGIAVDNSGNAYVTGYTASTEASFPVKTGPDLSQNGDYDVFIAKVNALGTALSYCGYIGGVDEEKGNGVAVDSGGNAYVTGYTESTEASFPVKVGPDLTHNGSTDAFIAKVKSTGAELAICGYIGGSDGEGGGGIAVDSEGNAYVAGSTSSTEATFPVTVGPDLTYNGGNNDAFVAKISTVIKVDFLGTWDSLGVWYRNTETDAWVPLSVPATLISAGDVDGDSIDDLIGVWSSGLWVRNSKTAGWTKLSTNLPTALASGDMNGDGRDDVVGSWASGAWYRNSASGAWVLMSSSPASILAAGDIDGDNKDDLIGVWSSGLWVKKSSSGVWTKITANLPTDIAAGDMNGDGRGDILGSWPSGVSYRNSKTGSWVLMSSSPATLVAAGNMDNDSADDLIGVWATGVWVKKSVSGTWMKISGNLPRDIDAGLFRTGETMDSVGFAAPALIYTEAPGCKGVYQDYSSEGPGGSKFRHTEEENLTPFESHPQIVLGPGDPGLQFEVQENLVPRESNERGQEQGKRESKR